MINENENIINQVDCMVIKGSKDRDVLLSLSENVFSQAMDDLEYFNAYRLLLSNAFTDQWAKYR